MTPSTGGTVCKTFLHHWGPPLLATVVTLAIAYFGFVLDFKAWQGRIDARLEVAIEPKDFEAWRGSMNRAVGQLERNANRSDTRTDEMIKALAAATTAIALNTHQLEFIVTRMQLRDIERERRGGGGRR